MGLSPPGGRAVWADAVRTVACALVVLTHVNYLTRPGISEWWPGGFLSAPVFSITVPLFFAVAGYFARTREKDGRPIPPRRYFARLATRLGLPLLVWGAVLTWLGVEGPTESLFEAAVRLITGPWQLYFLFALLQLHALHYAVDRWIPAMRPLVLLAWAAGISLATFAVCDAALWQLGGESDVLGDHARKGAALWAVFYASGVVLRRVPEAFERLWRARYALLALALASAGAYVWELRRADACLGYLPQDQTLLAALPTGIFGALLVLSCAWRLGQGASGRRALVRLAGPASDTFAAYLVHTAVLFPLYAWYQGTRWYSVDAWTVPALWAVTAATSVGLARLWKWPFSRPPAGAG